MYNCVISLYPIEIELRRILKPYMGRLSEVINLDFIIKHETECLIYGDVYREFAHDAFDELFDSIRMMSEYRNLIRAHISTMIDAHIRRVLGPSIVNTAGITWISTSLDGAIIINEEPYLSAS